MIGSVGIMNGPEALNTQRCRKRKGTYSKVGNVFAVLVVCTDGRCGGAQARAHDSSARGPSLLCSIRAITLHSHLEELLSPLFV